MLKLKFLGANGSCQDHDSGNTSILFGDGENAFCVDLSVNMSTVVDANVDAVVLTHEHIDHVYALPSLLHQLWLTGRAKPLYVYIPAGMENLVNGMIDLFNIRSKKNIFDIHVEAKEEFQVGRMQVRTFPTDHANTSLGLVVEEGGHKIVYTCDTRPIKEPLAVMEGAQVLVHETSGLYTDEETLIKKGHSSGADAGELAKKLGVERLYICHMPRGDEKKQAILAEARSHFANAHIPEILKEYTL